MDCLFRNLFNIISQSNKHADALEKIPDGEASSEIIAAIILSLSQQRIAQGAIFSFIGGLILTVCMYWTFAEKSNDTRK